MAEWTLQNNNRLIRLAVNSLGTGHFCPPIAKKVMNKRTHWPKISASSNFGPRSTFLSSNLFSKVLFLFGIIHFFVEFLKNWVPNSKILFKIFQKRLLFWHFLSPSILLTTWMTEWTLQNNNRLIRLAENSLRTGHFCPPNAKKVMNNDFQSAPKQKLLHDPHTLFSCQNLSSRKLY